jgi:hypothetical protein
MNIPIIPSPSSTSLRIASSYRPVDFHWLLSTFPLLEDFDVSGFCTWNTSNHTNTESTRKFPNLLNLHANWACFNQTFLDSLSLNAPSIEVLDLNLAITTTITIDISCWELKKMRIQLDGNYCYLKINTSHAEEMIKLNTTNDTVTLVGHRAFEIARIESPIVHITSTVDKRFMFYKYTLSLAQNQITLTGPNQ